MAKSAHLDIFRTGCERAATGEGRCCDAWNAWRQNHPVIDPDLSGEDLRCIMQIDEEYVGDMYGFNLFRTDLSGCDIQGFDIRKSVLREANLSHATLLRSTFVSANLKSANLSHADLRGVDFRNGDLTDSVLKEAIIGLDFYNDPDSEGYSREEGVDLRNTDFSGASLIRANLRGVRIEKTQDADEAISSTRRYHKKILLADNGVGDKITVPKKLIYDFNDVDIVDGASFASADMTEANFEDAVLSAIDMGVDFRCSVLISAKLSSADITNAKLWQAITEGWNIKGIKCSTAYWDRDGREAREYGEGEFERAFGEKPRIVLRYPGGMSAVDLAMLPLVVERLQAKHPGCALHIRSVEDAGSGATVTITVDDLIGRDAETFMGEFETLRCSLMAFQQQLRHEERLRLQFRGALQCAGHGYCAIAA